MSTATGYVHILHAVYGRAPLYVSFYISVWQRCVIPATLIIAVNEPSLILFDSVVNVYDKVLPLLHMSCICQF